ncbi:MAG: trypsin-like peptidase domain-containing protein [Candidatus Magasanikbacteria bacterium]|nr:trypsin-like peptidase domain-containing protein [Candidatus Magasanikbacteria bacterium]MCA9389183.1 trypsin-like peptidase domain-containing protein [Candidatus Magasanikbacteria bacterium]MCA9391190.1 trypsin-like peptidase domain-containing protein [Candidatus Magasanikbacteria bacterium]USN52127.1 MAG: trypsin-like peptidase domain-containing protein [Candidatus Nomurabacteria bacterium]HPF95032.1 trypsin-like peptidase domain-containing protein [bacterium]
MKTKYLVASLLGASIIGGASGATIVALQPRLLSSWNTQETPAFTLTKGGYGVGSATVIEQDDIVAELVAKVSPSVVSIDISKSLKDTRKANDFYTDDFVLDNGGDDELLRIGGGSGFFVSGDGLIVTNRHVIDDTEASYVVVTQDGTEYEATVAGIDPVLDLGFLKIEGSNFPAIELGDSDQIRIGQTVIAIGNALAEFQNTVTKGIVSGLDRRLEASGSAGEELIEEAIQTDAAINPGNSGGPLIDLQGRVIGVNTAVTDGAQSLGFALPSNAIQRAVDSMRKYGRIIRPWIGVRYIQVDADYAKRNALPYTYGALVQRGQIRGDLAIIPGSPADKAGLKENDLLLELNGKRLDIKHPLSSQVARFSPGDEITLKIFRAGEEKELKMTLEERKEIR